MTTLIEQIRDAVGEGFSFIEQILGGNRDRGEGQTPVPVGVIPDPSRYGLADTPGTSEAVPNKNRTTVFGPSTHVGPVDGPDLSSTLCLAAGGFLTGGLLGYGLGRWVRPSQERWVRIHIDEASSFRPIEASSYDWRQDRLLAEVPNIVRKAAERDATLGEEFLRHVETGLRDYAARIAEDAGDTARHLRELADQVQVDPESYRELVHSLHRLERITRER